MTHCTAAFLFSALLDVTWKKEYLKVILAIYSEEVSSKFKKFCSKRFFL